MLAFSLGFLILAVLAAVLGLHGIAAGAGGIACVLWVIFFYACIETGVLYLFTRNRTAPPF
jgi:uncharacterized membrane protein YtjA (UPF0391 family)